MNQAPNITEDEVVEYLLALEETGASLEEMRAYLRATKTEEIGEAYLALFQSFRQEREHMKLPVTESGAVRYSRGEVKRTRLSLAEILTGFTHMFSWRYMAPGMTVVAVLVVTWAFVGQKGKEPMVAVEEVQTIETGAEQEVAVNTVVEPMGKKMAPSQQEPVTEEGERASQSDIDALVLASIGGEGTESFADEDATLDMSSDDALLDNDEFYDETIF